MHQAEWVQNTGIQKTVWGQGRQAGTLKLGWFLSENLQLTMLDLLT